MREILATQVDYNAYETETGTADQFPENQRYQEYPHAAQAPSSRKELNLMAVPLEGRGNIPPSLTAASLRYRASRSCRPTA
ncbi:MAG TPA: hypothetical protein DDY22_22490 [Geobacter sp.]|nr:hypothetical protein [Geobacter sp.]